MSCEYQLFNQEIEMNEKGYQPGTPFEYLDINQSIDQMIYFKLKVSLS